MPRQPGLGEELEDEIDVVIDVIRRFPSRRRSGSTAAIGALLRSTVSRSRFRIRSSATTSSFSRWRTRAGVRVTGRGDVRSAAVQYGM
jgi:hypothetical protein